VSKTRFGGRPSYSRWRWIKRLRDQLFCQHPEMRAMPSLRGTRSFSCEDCGYIRSR
jgi:hypothetical protein